MAVLVTVISIEASTITSIKAAVTHPRCTLGEILSPARDESNSLVSSSTAVPPV